VCECRLSQQQKEGTRKRRPKRALNRKNDLPIAVGSDAVPTARNLIWHPCQMLPIEKSFFRGLKGGGEYQNCGLKE
jgi:hypothetical protein